MNPRASLFLLPLLAALVFGCDDTSTSTVADASVAVDMRRNSPSPRPPASDWTKGTIEGDGSGLQPSIATTADGRVGVAYFKTSPFLDGDCTEIGDTAVPMRTRWPVRYAEMAGTEWRVETVHEPILFSDPSGLSLAFDGDGRPVVATMTGEPLEMYRYCGANDVGLLTKMGEEWSLETAVVSSGEAATNPPMPGSDFGEVVGYWPSLAFGPDGNPVVAYKDVHAGSIQGDDLTRADMEFATKSGGWSTVPVDAGEGAGEYNQVVFDTEGRPVILYYNAVEQGTDSMFVGLWIARPGEEPGTWDRYRISENKTTERPSIALNPADGSLVVAFYNPIDGRPYLARQSDPTSIEGWELERLGDDRYDEGVHPSIAFDPEGRLAITWYRCNRRGEDGQCDAQHDAVVFWWLADDEWVKEVIDTGDDGQCGTSPVLAFDAEGRAVVAYKCIRGAIDEFDYQLDYARRKALR